MADRLKAGVLASKTGSNLLNLIHLSTEGKLLADIVAVASNKTDCGAIRIAIEHGIPVGRFPIRSYESVEQRDNAMAKFLQDHGVELVVLAGYDRVLSVNFVRQFEGRIINLHPSLLPAFAGTMHAIEQAFDEGVKVSGVTVHFVTEDVDRGPIILQKAVPVLEDDTVESFTERIHKTEYELLPMAINLIAQQRVFICDKKVRILGGDKNGITESSSI
jgi:phosphoribosylglycinamide formyltransferase-1